jgi:hypothetical protein
VLLQLRGSRLIAALRLRHLSVLRLQSLLHVCRSILVKQLGKVARRKEMAMKEDGNS